MKGLIIIAFNNFRDEEFFIPYNFFKDNNIDTTVASLKTGTATGSYGGKFEVLNKISDMKSSDFDFIFFVGGSGSTTIRNDDYSLKLAKSFYDSKRIVAAICLAPTILAKAGLLKNKTATVWPGIDPELNKDTATILQEYGCTVKQDALIIDKTIITGRDYLSSLDLAKSIASKI